MYCFQVRKRQRRTRSFEPRTCVCVYDERAPQVCVCAREAKTRRRFDVIGASVCSPTLNTERSCVGHSVTLSLYRSERRENCWSPSPRFSLSLSSISPYSQCLCISLPSFPPLLPKTL
ncbi:hypothetical protein V5799_016676 [Amblyomma americanum]|uniref:Uncharacterized protein n=1 Tax=Amblyomma americanum TaxID=6943 RepID=A0AAQ4F529_AMBAM